MSGGPRHTGVRVRAVPPRERLDRDGEAIALVGTSVLRLSAVAVAVLDGCADTWTDPAELSAMLRARFGAPDGDADVALRSLVETLAGAGLLELA
ncbi:hypothetical protein ASD62_15545 [Phycicoccus sp. Root563]|uniref:PqqD family protein n=1 Tax=unclassified Phycicoccus TaxID=2637926 RepID=UPI00070323C9|nr:MULTISPECIES: PqqD family protein [unclassified Phycicoccus]KQU69283.1 hypothetical protein ASC58_05125 [Phycicoccus sp. Root101]KQZ90485.1 hypothetical protein ASD62_15545 [Phycicoccus sp. Root563]